MDPATPHVRSDDRMETRISQFLGEFRIMVPGLAALLGFQLISAYSSGWNELPHLNKTLNYAAVLCTVLALAFVIVPGLYHRSMREIEENDRFLRFAARYFGLGMASFGVGLVITVYPQGHRVFQDQAMSLVGASAIGLVLVIFWIAVPLRRVRRIQQERGDASGTRQRRLPGAPMQRPGGGAAGRQL